MKVNTKYFGKLLALATAFLFAVLVLLTPAKLFVGATDTERSVYYISDYGKSESTKNMMENLLGTEVNWFYCGNHDDTADMTSEDYFEDLKASALLEGIHDADVVFEMRDSMNLYGRKEFTDSLEDTFSEWKRKNCRIMFICGTDELQFADCNNFLHYVDIHVNTDVLSTFIYNVFLIAFEEGGDQWTECNFFLDRNLVPDAETSWFLKKYFFPFYNTMYKDDIDETNEDWQAEVFWMHHVNVYSHKSGDDYYDLVKGASITLNPFYEDFCDTNRNYPIGIVKDLSYSTEWENTLQEFLFSRNSKVDKFFKYNMQKSYMDEEGNIYRWTLEEFIEKEVQQILKDFLYDMDLSGYDNWSGDCNITHKTIKFGEDGWMRDVARDASSEFLQIIEEMYASEDTDDNEDGEDETTLQEVR